MKSNQVFAHNAVPVHGHLFSKSLFNHHVSQNHHRARRFRHFRPWSGMFGAAQVPDQQVLLAQSCLAQSVDPSVPQDGLMGFQTQQAIRTFQSQQGLPPTGGLGAETVAALQAACSGQSGGGPGPMGGQMGGQTTGAGAPPSHVSQHTQGEGMLDENEDGEVRVEGRFFRPSFRPPERFPQNRWNWNRDHHDPIWRDRRNWTFDAAGGAPLASWAQSCLAQIFGPWVLQGGPLGVNAKRALLTFQGQNGLPETGILDRGTTEALQAACGNQMPLQGEAQEEEEINPGERDFVLAQIAAKQRDSHVLTDAVFFKRHPELGGRRLRADEPKLGKEWLAIRDGLVEPLLGSPSLAHNGSSGVPGSRDSDLREALAIARKPVPDMPGISIQQLVEKWRPGITPEIPLPVLLAFIKFESGGHFDNATHGNKTNKPPYTSPRFYELGLFQTPGGDHGHCTTDSYKSCEFLPPGPETAQLSPWARLSAKYGTIVWTNPDLQVRVGLASLEEDAAAIRKIYPDLFATHGNDWDIRAAFLLTFAGGRGFVANLLKRHRNKLANQPPELRWDLLGNEPNGSGGKIRCDARFKNVDEKMFLAAKLGYTPA